MKKSLSIILPAKNESASLKILLPELTSLYEDAEIIVVNDGSDDDTLNICNKHDVKVINHPYSKGNGASIKSGARFATGEILVFMDADGQHRPDDIKNLLNGIDENHDMVIGARDRVTHASVPRYIANVLYNKLASYMSGHKIYDLTSGFRAVKANVFKQFLYLLPNGFSYPTTITMALFRSGYSVKYVPISCEQRTGNSHIKLIKDGFKFLLIIFRITALYSPLKIFFPASLSLFIIGISYYGYTYLYHGQFTNMSIFILLTSVIIFLIGLLSEQITFLIYSQNQKKDN
jgi:glycosyltransferase involved in cell wall biosynthesis